MLRPVIPAAIAVALVALALSGRGSSIRSPGAAMALAPSLAVDACIEVDAGDTFTVAISVAGVTNLLAWDIYYAYDRKVVEVVGRDVRQFLDKEPNSNVFDLSDPVPNTSGLYRIGAADVGGPGTEENGSGVLAVLTLRARSEGLSWSSLGPFDANADGDDDLGPTLTEFGGGHIGDSNGDGIFDGTARAGQIAVGRGCGDPDPTPFVEEGTIVISPSVNTPRLSSPAPTPTRRPDGSTVEPDDPGATPEPSSPASSGAASRAPSASPTPDRAGGGPGSGSDNSSGGLSPLLAALIGGGGGAGLIASYLIFRAARRPA